MRLVFFGMNLFLMFLFACRATEVEEAFSRVYRDAWWGKNENGEGYSGEGSLISTTESYRLFLEQFFQDFNIQTVVDAGCGDWSFSKVVNWNGIDYKGYDVVASVIEKNQKNYSNDHIQFFHVNILTHDLPSADLLICKDVLQHLPIEDIQLFLNQLSKYNYCLITNDVFSDSKSSHNSQIDRGHYRPLDLTQPPFNIKGYKVLSYLGGQTLKQVLLIVN